MEKAKEKVFVSSSLNSLKNHLEDVLFKEGSFWQKKVIVVPSSEYKEWLQKSFVQNKKAVLGLEFVESSSLGSFFSKWLFSQNQKRTDYCKMF